MKKMTVILAMLLCLAMTACGKEKTERPVPTRSTEPIMDMEPTTPSDKKFRTSVYVTVYEDTAYLAAYPYEIPEENLEPDQERLCVIREISKGGTILCGKHEGEVPITTVVILEAIGPESTAGWFSNMTQLREINGLRNLRMESVTDMSYMFSGCKRLDSLEADDWDVSSVTDMTGIFDGCEALAVKPSWYQQ